MKKIKICRITDSFPPPWTGLAPATYELSAAQARIGCEVHVIAKYTKGCKTVDQMAPFTVHRIRGKLILFEIMAFFKLISLNRKYNFDILHSHGSSFFFFHVLRKFFPKYWIFEIPLFVSVHNIREYQDKIYREADFFSIAENILNTKLDNLREKKHKMLKRHIWQRIKQRISYKDADYLLPVSNSLKKALIQTYSINPQKIYILYNGVSSFVLKQSTKNIKCNFTEKNRLLFVGRTIGTKNEVALLKALPAILKSCPDTNLTIIGDGYWHDTLKQVAKKLGIEQYVTFLRHVPHKEIVTYYKNANVFVFPSFSEGLPKVVLEAMACGLPVVASNVDGNNELVIDGYNGYLIDPYNIDDMVEKVVHLLKNKELAIKMGQNGRDIVLKSFTWDNIAKLCNEYYNNCLSVIKD